MRYEENTEQAEKGREGKGRGGEGRRGEGRGKKRRNGMRRIKALTRENFMQEAFGRKGEIL